MREDISKKFPFGPGRKNEKASKNLQDKSVKRFWGNAARLEHSNVRNKNKGKKG
ncbi:MAG: hypothetical protein Q7S10_01775 [bacterium]|nr:hypothetical protein [bacterium]